MKSCTLAYGWGLGTFENGLKEDIERKKVNVTKPENAEGFLGLHLEPLDFWKVSDDLTDDKKLLWRFTIRDSKQYGNF